MSISEKLVTIAENEQKVYESGQKSMIDESKIIEKTLSGGNILYLEDVSEVPHKVKVQLSADGVTDFSNTKVKVYESNLIQSPFKSSGTITNYGIQFTVNSKGYVTINGTATAQVGFTFNDTSSTLMPELIDGVTYKNIRIGAHTSDRVYFVYVNQEGATKYVKSGNSFTWSKDYTFVSIYIQIEKGSSYDNLTVCPLIVPIDSGVEYPVSTDGKCEVLSKAPMYIATEENAKINITTDYHKSWGTQVAYDTFWDSYQTNGTRGICDNMFSGKGWNNLTFKPKYDIRPSQGYMLLRSNDIVGDLVEILSKQGITLDTSRCSSMAYAFSVMNGITRVGTISLENIGNNSYNVMDLFASNPKLETIDLIIPPPKNVIPFTFFTGCTDLKNIRIGGTIRGNVNMQQCPLTLESAKDIILHLANQREMEDNGEGYPGWMLTFSDATWALLEADTEGYHGSPWRDYVEHTIFWQT